jgi:hypothetical protein
MSEDPRSELNSSSNDGSLSPLLHHDTSADDRERGNLRRVRAVRLMERLLEETDMSADDLANALVVTRETLEAYREGRTPMPLERQLCLALLVIERQPSLARQAHRLRGQVQAEAAFHARATKTHMVAPVSKHWR